MEVGSPEWIEASLARLDDLERQRGEHEAAIEAADDPAVLKQHTAALEQLDAEIKSLYAQLEAVAEDDEDEDEDEGATEGAAPQVTQGDDELSAPHPESAPEVPVPAAAAAPAEAPAAAAVAEPLAAPAAADNPFSAPPAAGGGGGFDSPAPVTFDDDDLKPKGGGGKWVFLLVVLLGAGGVGGYFAWQNMQAQKADANKAPEEPIKVIKAAEVPDDTEAPPTAPSGKATISPNAAGDDEDAKKKKKKKDEDEKRPIKLSNDDAPLGKL